MLDENRKIPIDSFWRFIKCHSELCCSDILPAMTSDMNIRDGRREGRMSLVHVSEASVPHLCWFWGRSEADHRGSR